MSEPHCEIVHFRGDEYPGNFRFVSQYENGADPVDGTIVGIALSYIRDLRTHEIKDDDQVLVWDKGSVVAMRKKNHKNRYNGKTR